MRTALVVDHVGVFAEAFVIAALRRLAKRNDRGGIVHMIFLVLAAAKIVEAEAVERRIHAEAERIERVAVAVFHALADLFQTNAAHATDGVGEILIDDVLADADGLEDLAGLIRLQRRDAHFGRNLDDTVQNGVVVVVHGGMAVLVENADVDAFGDAFMRKIRIDRPRAVAQKRGKMMHRARLGAFQNDRDRRALFRADQMLLHRRDGKKARDGNVVFVHTAVGQNQNVRAVSIRAVALHIQPVERALQRRVLIIKKRNRLDLEPRLFHRADLHQIRARQNGVMDLKNGAVFGTLLQKIAVGADVDGRVRDDFLANRVDRRVRDLREKLFKIGKQRLMLFRQDGKRDIRAHRARRLDAVLRHRHDHVLDVVVSVAEGLIELVALRLRIGIDAAVRDRQIAQAHEVLVEPLAVGLAGGVVFFALFVRDEASGDGVDQKHAARLKARFFDDLLRRDVQNADFGGKDQHVVARDVIARRTKPVAVQNRTNFVAVAEENGRGTVPRLHHRGVIAIKIALFARHVAVVRPRFRDRHHHRKRQIHTVHDEELDRVVEHGGVRPGGVDHGQNLVHILAGHHGAGHGLLSGEHTIDVAADGVDLTVMKNEAVGMRTLPRRIRVRRKARVDKRDGALAIAALQVGIKAAKLIDQKHSFIYDRPARKRDDVGIHVALLEHAPRDVQPPIELEALFEILRPRDEALHNIRHAVARLVAENIRLGRHAPPSQKRQSFFFRNDLEHLLRLRA